MTNSTDLAFSLKQCTTLEREARELLDQIEAMDAKQKRITLRTIEQKISRARDYISAAEMEIVDLTDQRMIDDYTQKKEEHAQTVRMLEAAFQDANRSVQTEEHARAQGATPQDLMGRGTRLQGEQVNAINNALRDLEDIQNIGGATLEEIADQREAMVKVSSDLAAMDSELEHGKMAMISMLARARGDNCVRLFAILVIIAVVVVVVIEIISPGAVKKNSDAWFNNEQVE
jgi:chromosome segregation ATPase